ncbi:ras GEF [Gonapodya prolifera JEL478]|uniref:Ras GEF n=1 Tax=Gonapodya prolifera (strain JEL478) TaxID=1344416 RepID=A0A139AMV7_GONPJ|nr:ras GEF [Gonapodya prolifera JEL478]|eukprot:KXS18101.1 ras GEF [Gonapodya prolifera JEL478]
MPKLLSKPPFLGYTHRRDEISFNGDGQVLGGTFAALVERLTLHDTAVDPTYRDAFLMTFREFSSPQKLLQALKDRFLMEPPKVDTSTGQVLTADQQRLWNDKKLEPVRLMVINTFKTWLEAYWLDADNVCVEDMKEFIESKVFDKYDGVRHLLLRFIKQKNGHLGASAASRILLPVLYDTPPPPLAPPKLTDFGLLDLDPLEVARQITIIEMHTFCAIKPSEMLHQNWMRVGAEDRSMNVRSFVQFSNRMSQWVVRSVLDPVDARIRARYLKFFIKLGTRLLELSNYNGVMAVRAGLNAAPVTRMKVTWDLLGAKNKSAFERIERATDSTKNFAEYRTTLRSLVPPALPFLGIALSDLTFAYEGNPDFRGPKDNLINFDKYHRVADIINGLRRFQRPFNLRPVPEIAAWIEARFAEGAEVPAPNFNNVMYEVSLEREPRSQPVATVREAGMMRASASFGSISKLFDKA